MTRFLVINGPNLNLLGRRSPEHYGTKSLPDIEASVAGRARELGIEVAFFQSNSEGALIDYIQCNSGDSRGIIINPGALTHYGYSLRDALADTRLPIVEVHISNIHAREGWRRRSVVAEVATGQVSGLGWRSYLLALEALTSLAAEEVIT